MTPASSFDDCERWLSASLRGMVGDPVSRDPEKSAGISAPVALVEALYAGDLATVQVLLEPSGSELSDRRSHVLERILPAIYQIEENWRSDARSYTDTLCAFWNLQKLLNPSPASIDEPTATASDPALEDRVAPARVILATAPGSEHTFGIQLVGEHFRALGWDPQVVPQTTRQSLLDLVNTRPVDVLGLSVGHDAALAGLTQFLAELRSASQNPGLRILLGGNIFTMSQAEYAWLGADCVARSADEAFNFCRLCSPQRFQ